MILKSLALVALLTTSASAVEPGPIWEAEGKTPDPHWSETYFAVDPDAVRPRVPYADETPAEKKELDAAWEAGIRTYLRRVSNMVAGMNLQDETDRLRHCAAMADLVSPRFLHTEGRRNRTQDGRGGFAVRTAPQLVQACKNRAFKLDGFYALTIRAIAVSPRLVQVTTCYYHDQYNDPLVTGGGRILPTNGRQAIPRVSVETVELQPDNKWRIAVHVALDSDEKLIREGCSAQ